MQHRLSFLDRFRSRRHATSSLVRLASCALALAGLSACSSSEARPSLGQSAQPILRGQVDHEHPQVLLLANQAGFLCTGTLIQVREQTGFLLTAAHCVTEEDPGASRLPAEQFVVLAGTDFLDSTAVFAVDEIRVHPAYDGTFANHDVAVVRIDLGDSTPPPAIPPLSAQEDALAVDDRLLLVGYGQTESDEDNSLRRHVTRNILELDAQLVTYTQEDGKGTCF